MANSIIGANVSMGPGARPVRLLSQPQFMTATITP